MVRHYDFDFLILKYQNIKIIRPLAIDSRDSSPSIVSPSKGLPDGVGILTYVVKNRELRDTFQVNCPPGIKTLKLISFHTLCKLIQPFRPAASC
jgi:hypothetical protein